MLICSISSSALGAFSILLYHGCQVLAPQVRRPEKQSFAAARHVFRPISNSSVLCRIIDTGTIFCILHTRSELARQRLRVCPVDARIFNFRRQNEKRTFFTRFVRFRRRRRLYEYFS